MKPNESYFYLLQWNHLNPYSLNRIKCTNYCMIGNNSPGYAIYTHMSVMTLNRPFSRIEWNRKDKIIFCRKSEIRICDWHRSFRSSRSASAYGIHSYIFDYYHHHICTYLNNCIRTFKRMYFYFPFIAAK